ncbi:MAG: hypothetical protein IPI46_13920 [Bacteroidetes bacterium]|nr:hypothetical protein [Bacteroidota bacterium]
MKSFKIEIDDYIDLSNSSAYFNNKQNLEILIAVFEKFGKSTHSLYESLAINEDIIITEHPNDEDFGN